MPRVIPGVPTNDEGVPAFTDPEQEQDPETQRAIQDLIDRQQPWRQATTPMAPEISGEPDWMNQPPDQYLAENPPFDFHNDPHALTAIMPESPELPWFRDSTHEQHHSRAGKLLRILAYGAMGAAAGAGARTMGEGFSRGQMAGSNLQQLALQRQQARDLSDWRQAQTQRVQAQTAQMPQQAATMEDYRRARIEFLRAQSARIQEQADELKRGKNDKLLHTYTGNDGKIHFLFQHGNRNETYEQVGERVYKKPEGTPRPLLAHGPDGSVYLIHPETGDSRQVIRGKEKPRLASPDYFRHVEQYKEREWRKIQNDSLLSPEEKLNRLQDLETHYGRLVETGGGTYTPYDVRSGTKPTPQAPTGGQGFWGQVPGAVRRH